LRPLHLVEQLQAVLLAGGSAFGLDAASGVVRYLEELGLGFDTGAARVPIVPAAILFDLGIGQTDVRPDSAMGYQACLNASSEPVVEGNIGAGTGCTVGKMLGMEQAMKAGIGSTSIELGDGVVVGALAAVNAFGDAIDPTNGMIIAGARSPDTRADREDRDIFANTLEVMKAHIGHKGVGYHGGDNTVIGVVATNAALNKESANFVAQMAQDGLARTIRPAHTMLDGDTIFALSTGDLMVDLNTVGAFAAEALSQAILRAVWTAEPAGGLPAASSYSQRI
jgi:L-aminopeptidase/D-esterase-like protein